jgi:hypothetical protein
MVPNIYYSRNLSLQNKTCELPVSIILKNFPYSIQPIHTQLTFYTKFHKYLPSDKKEIFVTVHFKYEIETY